MTTPTDADRLPAPLPAEALRWICPPEWLTFDSTSDVEPVTGILGQPDAVEALEYGLSTTSPGHHVFVRGLAGTGRATLLTEVMETCCPSGGTVRDHVCVPRFDEPMRPRLIALPRGTAREFARRVEALGRFVVRDLAAALRTDAMRARRQAVMKSGEERFDAMLAPFEKSVADAGAALVTLADGGGPGATPTVFAMLDDEPVPPEALRRARAEGRIDEATFAERTEATKRLSGVLSGLLPELESIREAATRELQDLDAAEIRRQLAPRAARLTASHSAPGVADFMAELVDAVAEHGPPAAPGGPGAGPGPSGGEEAETGAAPAPDVPVPAVFVVNVLRHHEDADRAPVVIESAPSRAGVFGTIEVAAGEPVTPHLAVRAGSLLMADGGFLVVEARDLVQAGNVWTILARTLRSRRLEIESPAEQPHPGSGIKPDPIELRTKVVMVGDVDVHAFLEANDPDFSLLFKITADFESTMVREAAAATTYAGVLARVSAEEGLPPFGASAVGALLEHGARIASDAGRLTARLGRVCDIAREAAWITQRAELDRVDAEHVRQAIRRGRRRASLPARRFHDRLADGTLQVTTQGAATGQINGLATMRAGPLTWGFPQRITAVVGPGSLGLVNVEHEAALSGSIHTKGFHILRGVLHHLLRLAHPLSLDGSIVFEQSYGGVDGDSASTAEACCLISALTGVPLRQDLAITGAIDQRGRVMAIGAVSEKIDGFHDACARGGLTGTQGVIIPQSNVAELALREDVVEACRTGTFRVHAVSRVEEALSLLMDQFVPPVPMDPAVAPTHGLLADARAQAERLWRASSRHLPSESPMA